MQHLFLSNFSLSYAGGSYLLLLGEAPGELPNALISEEISGRAEIHLGDLYMKRFLLLVASAALAILPQAVFAAGVTEEIIVTATKREESIQDVPIAVSAYSGEDLAARGVQDLYGLQEVSPSIAVYSSNSTSNGGTLRIRGVGTTGNNPGLEAAVGTFIDGVYRSRAGLAFGDLVDIERVEVLRGPQGTLFGKNTVAGALNILTKKPAFENSGSIQIGAGNLSSATVQGNGNFVLVDDVLAARVSGSWQERDGYYEVTSGNPELIGDEYDSRDRYSVKAQLLWTPNDTWDARLIADYTERDEDCCPAAYWRNGSATPLVLALGGTPTLFEVDGDQEIGANYEPFEDVEDRGISLEVNWNVGDITVTSITSFRDYEVARGQDIDFGSADILAPQDSHETFENFSQEFQLKGTYGDNFDWLVGFYYYTEDLESDEIVAFSNDGPLFASLLFAGDASLVSFFSGNPRNRNAPNQGYDASYFSETEGYALFTHNTWHMSEKSRLTMGLRISEEEKEAGAIINGAPFGTAVDDPLCQFSAGVANALGVLCENSSWTNKEDEAEWTGTLSYAHQFTDSFNAYVGISRGYKAGGYNLDQEAVGTIDPADPDPLNATMFIDQSRFDPETSTSYELGVKSEWMEGRLTINGALFYTDFEDFQLNTFNGLGFTITNLPEAVTQGIELEGSWVVSDTIFVTAGVTYADARYGDDLPDNRSIEDKRLTQSPLWQGSAAVFVDDQLPVGDWRYTANLNYSIVGEANTGSSLTPEKIRGTYGLFNGSLGVRSPDERYEIQVWGRNLTDKRVNSLVFDSVFQGTSRSVFLNPPRTYGVTFRANFGQ